MLISPILCLASHLGYILLAWLTEPSKCTTIFLFCYFLNKHVNTQTFCLLIFLGFIFFVIMIMIISIIIVLPLSSEKLATYLFNILQLLVVIISTQVGYKIFFDSGIDLKKVLLTFRKVFAEKES